MRKESGGGRKAPHAWSTGIDYSEGVIEWAESGGGEVRGAMHLRRSCTPEDEVHEIPPETHEHQAISWTHSLPRTC